MKTPPSLQDLIAELAHAYPTAQWEFDPLPSGVCFLWVTLSNGRDFSMEYDPKCGTGVSENFSDTPPFVGHDEVYDSLERGIVRFRELLAEAAHTTETNPSSAFAFHDKPISK